MHPGRRRHNSGDTEDTEIKQVSKKTVRLESRVRNRKIPQTRRGNRKRVFEPPILSDTLMISSPNTDLLVDELESLCQEEGVDSPFEHALATAMQTLEVDTVTRLSSWGHCCLLAVPVLAADVSRLKQQLMIAAAPGTLPDNAVLRTIVGGIARSVPRLVAAYDKSKEPPAALSPATVVKGPAVSADKLEREECATCYDDLRRLQNRTVDLPERATCVSAGRHSVVQYGYIAELPSVKAVKTYGTAGALKRRVALAGMEAGAGAHITFDEKKGVARKNHIRHVRFFRRTFSSGVTLTHPFIHLTPF